MPALSFSLKNNVINDLIVTATATGISRSNLVNKALEDYLPKVAYLQKLEKSSEEFETGRVVKKSLEELEALENE